MIQETSQENSALANGNQQHIIIAHDLSSLNSEVVFGDAPLQEVIPPERHYSDEVVSILANNVFGQKEACQVVAEAIVYAKSGFRDSKRPMGSMIFLGPTGVGKTELAKTVAQVLFPKDPEEHLITIDCTMLQEQSSVTRLKGSDPKYVGFGGDVLIMPESIKDGAVIIVDEIEKAHPEIWKWFMPVLEEGQTTLFLPVNEPDPNGSTGKKIKPLPLNFSDTFIIFTSNEGAREMQQARRRGNRSLGFLSNHNGLKDQPLDHTKIVLEALRNGRFGAYPEFLGRVDNTVIFKDLGPNDYRRIFDKFLANAVRQQVANDPSGHILLMVTPALRDWIIAQANTLEFGGRNIRNALQTTLLKEVANYKASGCFSPHALVLGYLDDTDKIRFRQK